MEFQEVCLVALDDTPAGRPPCTYISPGPPPWDILDCLVVHTSGPNVGDTFPLQPSLAPGHRVQTNGQVNLVAITATIIRCGVMPDEVGGGFDAERATTVARQTNADVWAIWNHVRSAKRRGALFAPVERELFMDPAVALNQLGGAAGWAVTVRTSLDGYAVLGDE